MNTRSPKAERQCVCGRCGIRHTPNGRTPGKDYCQDCRPEAAVFGWYDQPARGSRGNTVRKETA
ncbi:hypothetical protein ACFY5D_03540 [Paeniglutamicibacter sp. NPDC012692]|uniref:hypothetical protein n=1 Tax=Paeniglutamicibacter sp. NPDC012692 TaxID=3364388 RepID=UPI0036B7BC0D